MILSAGPPGSVPVYLRAILTAPLLPGADPHDPALWTRLLPGWTMLPPRLPGGAPTPEAQQLLALVTLPDRASAQAGLLLHALNLQTHPASPALASLSDDGRAVTLRLFGPGLTDLQRSAEGVVRRLVRERTFALPADARVFLAVSVGGVRSDLSSGRVTVGRGGALHAFYAGSKYPLNVSLVVLALTLLITLLVVPDTPYSPTGKAYGLAERVLSAVLLNLLLLASQFLYELRHRPAVAWDRA
jgi:hypothetical protein